MWFIRRKATVALRLATLPLALSIASFDNEGNFYGTSDYGGTCCGLVYELKK